MWIRRCARYVMFAERMERPSPPHRHFAIQLSLGAGAPLALTVEGGNTMLVSGFVMASQAEHGQCGPALSVFVDPLEPLGRRLRGLLGERSHHVLGPDDLTRFWGDGAAEAWLDAPADEPPDAALDGLLDALGAAPVPELDPRVARVVRRLRDDVTAVAPRSTLPELAALAGLSSSRLTHLFSEQVGLSIKQYVVWLRMVVVLERFSSASQLGALAHGVGFPDQAAFARTYREMWGRTPTSFRRHARAGQLDVLAPAARIKPD